jgi:hypothetical protein
VAVAVGIQPGCDERGSVQLAADKLAFTGTYVSGNFALSSDGSAGTDLSRRTPPAAAPVLASAMAAFGASSHAPAASKVAHAPPVLALAAAHGRRRGADACTRNRPAPC